MGMSRADFLAMTPAEFEAVAEAWDKAYQARERAKWLRTRRLAAILIRPHIKKAIPEEKLIPLPGDTPRKAQKKASPTASPEVTAARIAAFRSKC